MPKQCRRIAHRERPHIRPAPNRHRGSGRSQREIRIVYQLQAVQPLLTHHGELGPQSGSLHLNGQCAGQVHDRQHSHREDQQGTDHFYQREAGYR